MIKISSLKGKKGFQKVYNNGIRVKEKEVQLIILKSIEKGRASLNNKREFSFYNSIINIGIPINKKFGNAVHRNKAKRRIRSICRELLHEVDVSCSIIIRPSLDFKDLSYKRSKEIFESLFRKSGILQS
ncbi:MAG: ribonuclease P protein component [Spirochaetota bacterium]|nr:ribonuclease P protein component [Spirochaetota bacterium]